MKDIHEIDLHGIRHKPALAMVQQKLDTLYRNGSFSLTIITGNSTVLQARIFDEILRDKPFNYYIPSWNLGQIVVEYVVL